MNSNGTFSLEISYPIKNIRSTCIVKSPLMVHFSQFVVVSFEKNIYFLHLKTKYKIKLIFRIFFHFQVSHQKHILKIELLSGSRRRRDTKFLRFSTFFNYIL